MANTKTKSKLTDGVVTQPKYGFYKEWAEAEDLFCKCFGMTKAQHDAVHIEAINCRGSDYKERRFMRRIWRRETLFQDAGYYIEFFTASSPTVLTLAVIGPFEDDDHSAEAYDAIINHYGFNSEMIINKPVALDFDDLFEMDEDEGLFDMDDDDEGLWD